MIKYSQLEPRLGARALSPVGPVLRESSLGCMIELPRDAVRLMSPTCPPTLIQIMMHLILAQIMVRMVGGYSLLPQDIRIHGAHVALAAALNWLVALGIVLAALAASAGLFALIRYADSLGRMRPRHLAIRLFRGRPTRDRRWLCGAIRIARGFRWPSTARSWPGPGIVGAGLRPRSCKGLDLLPAEGDWLLRSSAKFGFRGGDATANLICLFFGIFPLLILANTWTNTPMWRPVSLLLCALAILFLKRFLVGVGALFRGMFDAHIDVETIEFAGPWRADRFERTNSIVYLMWAGPFVDATIIHLSGRRARLLLTRQGASKLLSLWGESRTDCR